MKTAQIAPCHYVPAQPIVAALRDRLAAERGTSGITARREAADRTIERLNTLARPVTHPVRVTSVAIYLQSEAARIRDGRGRYLTDLLGDHAPVLDYSGDYGSRVSVTRGGPLGVGLESWRGDRYSSRCTYSRTDCTATYICSERLGAALRAGLPMVIGGLVHVDGEYLAPGLWRVAAVSPRKGCAWTPASPVYLAHSGSTWAHGPTKAKARASARAQDSATRSTRRLARQLARMRRDPAVLVTRADVERAGLCEAGVVAWLSRLGLPADTPSLPITEVLGSLDQPDLCRRAAEARIRRA